MVITTALLGVAKIATGIITARVIGKGINSIGERITPYKTTRAYKQTEHSADRQKELEMLREAFQERLQKENIQAQERIAIFNRQSSMLLAQMNARTSLRHTLVQDAIRNFPLNISPLVLLENNNIDISFLLGQQANENNNIDSIIGTLDASKPINVFITPMHVDAKVNGKEGLANLIYDSVYSSLETVFVNEYSRNSERPVIFYSAAWNKNVRGGLHAADELYYFLKEMPTVVVEPRFDGKSIKLMFSCWGIGYTSHLHSRQELQIPLDFNSMLAISAYDRSVKALESLSNVKLDSKVIRDQCAMYEHNKSVFEQLGLEERITKRLNEIARDGKSSELDELGDFSKLMYISTNDIIGIADVISNTTGMMIAALADTHHLLANDVTPRFPKIYKQYFGSVDQTLLDTFGRMYERTYLKLSHEFPEQETRRLIEKESTMKLLGANGDLDKNDTIKHALSEKCLKLGATQTDIASWNVADLIDFYIEHIDNDDRFRKNVWPFMTMSQRNKLGLKLTQF